MHSYRICRFYSEHRQGFSSVYHQKRTYINNIKRFKNDENPPADDIPGHNCQT